MIGQMKIYKLLASLLLPAVAILLAAFAQLALTAVWPGVREIRSPIVTADGYFAALSSGVLCFCAGRLLRRWVGVPSGFVCAAIVPSVYLCLFLWAILGRAMWQLGAHIAWLRPITLFSVASAILPLLGLALGWWTSAPSPGHQTNTRRAAS